MPSNKRPAAILTDIEGTTTPIAFVRDTLFPFARARLAGFVRDNGKEAAVSTALDAARAEMEKPDAALESVIDALIGWIDADRKAPPLKTLQGMIWEAGYRDGSLTAPVYDDAAAALTRWHADGIRLAVYSSGSIAAQKLLFGHSSHGDLTGLFEGWFDLETGSKLAPGSYRLIADRLGLGTGDILFLSDHPGELDAAREAGLRTIRSDRGDPPPAPVGDHVTVTSFAGIAFD
ncbi:MAG: acireductone synthase [Proteobacteria bacterium]|nr:acireductone synthase [Pseudomonadota bacterium]